MGGLSNKAMRLSLPRWYAAALAWVVLVAMLACEAVAQQEAIGGHSDCFANAPAQVQHPLPTFQPASAPLPGNVQSGNRANVDEVGRWTGAIRTDVRRQPVTLERNPTTANGNRGSAPTHIASDRIERRSAPIGGAGYPSAHPPATATPKSATSHPVPEEVTCAPCASCGVNGEDAATCCCPPCSYVYQFLPDGLMYPTYLAGEKEPRFASVWMHETDRGWIWESALGGRVGIYRYGTPRARRPEGWQLDFEGAAFPRLDWDVHSDLEAVDFRVGVPLTWRRGATAVKFGYYHISSHVGDEFLERNPGFQRRNYVRDALLLGVRQNLSDDVVVYGEVAVAPSPSGGAEPWEFQFGTEYSPVRYCDCRGVPFAAVNGHLREEFDFGGSLNVVAGWQWWSDVSDRRFRTGLQYYRGKSMQYSFFDKHEELLGMGLWLDF